MNKKKIEAKLREQSKLAQKTFDCVPKQEAWEPIAILNEVRRHGSSMALKTLEGCLYSLKSSGLVRLDGDRWSQVIPSATIISQPVRVAVGSAAVAVAEPDQEVLLSPLEVLSVLADKAKRLVGEIETAALEISEYIEESEQKGQELKQLRELLRGIID